MKVTDSKLNTGRSYGMPMSVIASKDGAFGSMVCTLGPGEKSTVHNHFEREVFLFLDGPAVVTVGEDAIEVREGEVVEFEPFENHTILNPSDTDTIKFLSIYWPDSLAKEKPGIASGRKFLVFSTPPTPNGDLHLGHLSGPYLGADILRRALELRRSVTGRHVTGRDDHQTYTAIKAHATGRSEQSTASHYANEIVETLRLSEVVLDGLITPDRDGAYADFVNELVERLYEAGHIYGKDEPILVAEDGTYLHEGYVRGICPHCNAESDGNACEACGEPNQCVDLLSPVDRRTGRPAALGNLKRLYFRLSSFASYLEDYVRTAIMPAKVFALTQRMIAKGLPDICVSYSSPWGMKLRIPGYGDQILYVWFEMAAGYLFGAAKVAYPELDVWEGAKKAYSGDIEIIHSYGFDNAYYHTLLFPAVYHALKLDLVSPSAHVVNELLDLDGRKFSTSRNHLIWAKSLLNAVPSDLVRFGLALARPQGQRTNFSLESFVAEVNRYVTEFDNWENLLRKLCGSSATLLEPGAWLKDHTAYFSRIKMFDEAMRRALDLAHFAPHEAARQIQDFVSDSARFVNSQLDLVGPREELPSPYVRTAIALAALGMKAYAIHISPLMPKTAATLAHKLGIEPNRSEEALVFFTSGTELIFPLGPSYSRLSLKELVEKVAL